MNSSHFSILRPLLASGIDANGLPAATRVQIRHSYHLLSLNLHAVGGRGLRNMFFFYFEEMLALYLLRVMIIIFRYNFKKNMLSVEIDKGENSSYFFVLCFLVQKFILKHESTKVIFTYE